MKLPARLLILVFSTAGCQNTAETPQQLTSAQHASMSLRTATIDTVACANPTGHDRRTTGCEEFGNIMAIDRGPSLYVLDHAVLSEIARGIMTPRNRAGRGPGELTAPMMMGTGFEGGATVFDIARMRRVNFADDSGFAEHPVFPPPHFSDLRIANGVLYALAIPPAAAVGDTVPATIRAFRTSDSSWADTVATFMEPTRAVTGTSGALSHLPWERRLLWSACDDGSVIVASSDRWGYVKYQRGLSPHAVSMAGTLATPMSDEEHARVSQDWLERSPQAPASRELLARRLAQKPSATPVLAQVLCDERGTVFLRLYALSEAASARVDVIESDGRLVRSVAVPAEAQLLHARTEHLLARIDGADGLSALVRLGTR
jgi:hypothetical protein